MSRLVCDQITISDLELFISIGWGEEERSKPQRVLLTLVLDLDCSKAAVSKDINDTVCYSKLSKHLGHFSCQRSWVLLEEYLEAICNEVLRFDHKINQIQGSIKKFVIPNASWVAVEMVRFKNGNHL